MSYHNPLTIDKILPYLKTHSKDEIAEILGYSTEHVRKIMRTSGYKHYPKNYLCNHEYFKNWSNDMAYIVGFITADGNIHNKRPYLSIELQREDKEFLIKLKNKIYPDSNIYDCIHYDKRNKKEHFTSKWTFHSKEIIKDLEKYSIFPNKTGKHLLNFDIPKEYINDYVRGFFDGDGSIFISKNIKSVTFVCASVKFLESLQKLIPIPTTICYINNPPYIRFCKKSDVVIFRDWLYNSKSDLYLERKKKIFYE